MTKDEALKLALEALEDNHEEIVHNWALFEKNKNAILAIKEALAQPEQEPVGSLSVRYHRGCKSMTNTDFDYNGDLPEGDYELYTPPTTAQAADG